MTSQHVRDGVGFGRKLLLAAIGIVAVAGPVLFGLVSTPQLCAQSAAAGRPQFDAASIKPTKPGDKGPRMRWPPGGLLTATASVRVLIAIAYLGEFTESRLVVGGPDWIDSEGFQIEARAEGNPGRDEKEILEQLLLEDRFKLVLHHETRQLPIYALVLSKAGKIGPQLARHSDEAKCTDTTADKPLPQPGPGEAMSAYCGGFFMNPKPGDLRETGNSVTIDMLSAHLVQFLDRKVVNQTGLSGVFDFSIEFAPEMGPGSQPLAGGGAPDISAQPSIFTALQEQLGLKLESQKGPVDVLVIDHVEMPSEN